MKRDESPEYCQRLVPRSNVPPPVDLDAYIVAVGDAPMFFYPDGRGPYDTALPVLTRVEGHLVSGEEDMVRLTPAEPVSHVRRADLIPVSTRWGVPCGLISRLTHEWRKTPQNEDIDTDAMLRICEASNGFLPVMGRERGVQIPIAIARPPREPADGGPQAERRLVLVSISDSPTVRATIDAHCIPRPNEPMATDCISLSAEIDTGSTPWKTTLRRGDLPDESETFVLPPTGATTLPPGVRELPLMALLVQLGQFAPDWSSVGRHRIVIGLRSGDWAVRSDEVDALRRLGYRFVTFASLSKSTVRLPEGFARLEALSPTTAVLPTDLSPAGIQEVIHVEQRAVEVQLENAARSMRLLPQPGVVVPLVAPEGHLYYRAPRTRERLNRLMETLVRIRDGGQPPADADRREAIGKWIEGDPVVTGFISPHGVACMSWDTLVYDDDDRVRLLRDLAIDDLMACLGRGDWIDAACTF